MIRKETALDQTAIIVLSSKMFPQDKRQALEFGVNGFISKPIDPVGYPDKVNEIIASLGCVI